MAKRDFAFGKENFILIAVAVACIVLGFLLMSGGGSGDGCSQDVYSKRGSRHGAGRLRRYSTRQESGSDYDRSDTAEHAASP